MRYRQKRYRRSAVLGAVFLALMLLLVMISVNSGSMATSWREVTGIFLYHLTGHSRFAADIRPNVAAVIWEIRLPRILCAILTGMALASSGAIFQAILQNPLADPYTIGVSTGAAFGASLAIFFNVMFGAMFHTTLWSLAMAFITLILVIALSRRGQGLCASNLIISGIIISSFFSAGISLLKMLTGENVSAIIYWLMGSLNGAGWCDAGMLAAAILIAGIPAIYFSRDLNGMALGSQTAESLGIDVKNCSLLYLILGAVLTAVCVAACGVIGFVGLIVPHLIRTSLSADNRILLPLSGLCGGLLLGTADLAARLIGRGEIPVGVLTTLLGGPFFLLVYAYRKEGGRK